VYMYISVSMAHIMHLFFKAGISDFCLNSPSDDLKI
jgi:hypothetical protein